MDDDRDLFGAPITQIRERWGRPQFAKTKQNQELVSVLRAAGWSQERVAGYLGCDVKTLVKHFSRELIAGADIVEAMALQVLMHRMREGHAGSVRTLLNDVLRRGRAAPPNLQKPGKKSLASLAATSMPSRWADIGLPETSH